MMLQSLARFGPELALSATVAAVLVADLVLGKRSRQSTVDSRQSSAHRLPPTAYRRSVLASLGVLGLLAAGAALYWTPPGDTVLFSGMLALDGFARFFKGLFLAVAFFGVLFGASSDEIPEERYGEYLLLLFCLTLGLSLLCAAQNLLMIYLSIELVSLPSYILAGFRRGDRRSSEAALKYVVYGAAASGLMLYGFSLFYGLAGTLDLHGIGDHVQQLASRGPTTLLTVALAGLLSLAGFGYKVAAVPFHMWCPDVYEGAPTPFVAFLSVGPKAAGLAALIRFLLVGYGAPEGWLAPGHFPWQVILGVLAMATMTLGNLVAIAQDNVKRLLAYSSIAHAGYMLMAVAVGTTQGMHAVMLYLGIYLAMNMGAFLAVMAVRAKTGSESIADYRGLGSRSPYLAVVLAVFLFSLTGLPPLAGFIGKFYLFASVLSVDIPFFHVVALVGVLNSAVSLYYYARIVKAMYLDRLEGEAPAVPVLASHAALLALLAVPTLVLGVWWGPLAGVIDRASLMLK